MNDQQNQELNTSTNNMQEYKVMHCIEKYQYDSLLFFTTSNIFFHTHNKLGPTRPQPLTTFFQNKLECKINKIARKIFNCPDVR